MRDLRSESIFQKIDEIEFRVQVWSYSGKAFLDVFGSAHSMILSLV